VIFFDAKRGVVIGSGGTIIRTEDGGDSWKPIDINLKEWLYSIAFADDKTGYAVGEKESSCALMTAV